MVLILSDMSWNICTHVFVSVPLRGLWFLSFKGDVWDEKLQAMRFRPLAGIMVLINLKGVNIMKKYEICFRPLAGIMVLIETSQH